MGKTLILNRFSQLISFIHGCGLFDLADFPDAYAIDDPLFFSAGQAGGETAKTFDGPLHSANIGIRRSDDEIEFFIADLRIAGASAIDQSLHLRIHGIEIDRSGQNDDIGIDHPLQQIRHIVMLGTGFALFRADAAACAVINLPVTEKNLLYAVAGSLDTGNKTVAQAVRIAAAARTGGKTSIFLLICKTSFLGDGFTFFWFC